MFLYDLNYRKKSNFSFCVCLSFFTVLRLPASPASCSLSQLFHCLNSVNFCSFLPYILQPTLDSFLAAYLANSIVSPSFPCSKELFLKKTRLTIEQEIVELFVKPALIFYRIFTINEGFSTACKVI